MDILSGSADEFRQIRVFTHRYARPNDIRALAAYLATFAAYAFGFIAVFWGLGAGLWGVAVLGWGLTAFAIVRLYVIQHDCGHQSYFSRAIWNDWAGQLLSILSLSPYETMKSNHNRHHRYVGDLDHREDGEVYTMTLAEWEAASPWARRLYRAYRAPWIMLPLGALFTYFIRYRWPKNTATVGRRGVLLHNLALGLWLTALWAVAGELGLWIWFGTSLTAGILGVFQVYLQHNFEEIWWGAPPRPRSTRCGAARLLGTQSWLALGFGHRQHRLP